MGVSSGHPCAVVDLGGAKVEGGPTRSGSLPGGTADDGADAVAGITGLAVTIGAVAGGLDAATGTTFGSVSLPSQMLKWLGRVS